MGSAERVCVGPLLRDLGSPAHDRSLRDAERRARASGAGFQPASLLPAEDRGLKTRATDNTADASLPRTQKPGREADLSGGFRIEIAVAAAAALRTALDDFNRFMARCMKVRQRADGFPIHLDLGEPKGCPAGAREAFHILCQKQGARIVARDADGLRRALFWLEAQMTARRGPYPPLGAHARWAVVEDRICHSPCVSGRNLTGWELEDQQDYYPEAYLNKLAHCGANGIWAAGLLRRLVPSRVLPELGPVAPRLDKLKELVRRAGEYGIRVYLLGIEPRGVPNDHPVFAAHPEIKGARFCEVTSALCTSTPQVRDYIRDVTQTLFTEVPDLGGIINLYNGERGTTCWLGPDFVRTCPRCSRRPQEEVLGEDLNCFLEGIRAAGSSGRLLAWAYTMNTGDSMTAGPTRPVVRTIQHTHPEVVWLGNFEHGGSKTVAGKTISVHEYSLSYIGPSPAFSRIAEAAQARGARIYAKLQIGTTYELSSLPYLPVPGIVHAKFAALRRLGVSGAMLNWLPGGYPSPMLQAAGAAAFSDFQPSERKFLEHLAALSWGPRHAGRIARAWTIFSRAFQLYPCINRVLYFSPITRSPAYHLDLRPQPKLATPYNWGINEQRRRQPYEDQVERWLGPFSARELAGIFRKMGRRWSTGLALMRDCLPRTGGDPALVRQYAVAAAARLQFLSAANVIEFYMLRNRLGGMGNRQRHAALKQLRTLVRDDLALVKEMKNYAAVDPFIGFHTETLAYSYSPRLLEAKMRQSRRTLALLDQWLRSGKRPKAIDRPAPAAPPPLQPAPPSWQTWLEHGD